MLISTAYAQAAGGSTEQQILGFLPIILMFVVLYFLMIRPQMKRAKEQRAMLEALKKGDEVVTAGGILGRVIEVGDNFATLEIADGVRIKIQKYQITSLMPKGTMKGA